MWILSYLRILILVGLVLATGNVSLRFVKRELPVLVGGREVVGRVDGDGGKRKRIAGLEVLEGNIRDVIAEGREEGEGEVRGAGGEEGQG